MSKRIVLVAAAVLALAGLSVSAAGAAHAVKKKKASKHLLIGFNDEASTLYGNLDATMPILTQLHAQVLRVNLYWGGSKYAVSNKKPQEISNPGDPAYNWTLYDRLVRYASQNDIQLVFSILFTPKWANGGKARNVAPTGAAGWKALHDFAYAATVRYSGFFTPPVYQQDPTNASSADVLPTVKMWTAWNEPNNPTWLTPQYKRVGKSWRMESAVNYAKICNAVYTGVHDVLISPERGPVPGEKVACGVTDPRGNDSPRSKRPSVDPLSFMRALKKYGMKRFDVYAHHPYYGAPSESPSYIPKHADHAVQLGNINTLLKQLSKLWGPKHLWITEYGYQTTPEDKHFGVTHRKQAQYLTQAYAIARKNPRIDMMLWFMLQDDTNVSVGWQSGLLTRTGKKKPAFAAFQKLPH